jgi:phosphate/sulfate permease
MFGLGWACWPVLMVRDSPAIAIAIAGFIFPGTALYVFESIETLGKEIPCLTLAGSSSTLLSVSYLVMLALLFATAPKQYLTSMRNLRLR